MNGIYIVSRHVRLIVNKRKTLIIKAKEFKEHINEPLYLLCKNKIYGIIVLKEPYKISLSEFKKLYRRHCITEAERKRWWPEAKEFYAYDFELKKIFRPPLNWKYKKGTQSFVKDVEIEKSLFVKLLINQITPSKLRELSDGELMALHRRLHILYSQLFKLSVEDLVNVHCFVVQEMKERKITHYIVDELDEKTKSLEEKNLELEKRLKDPLKFFEYIKKHPLKGKIITPDYISVAGSYGRGEANKESDIDIVIRRKTRDISTEIRLGKQLSEDLQNRLSFVYNPEGPHGTYIPLYDLAIIPKKEIKQIKIEEEPKELKKITPGERFSPMKPRMAFYTDFYSVEELYENWAKARLDRGKTLYCSVKFDGFHSILTKNEIWFEDAKKDRSGVMPELIKELRKLDKEVILEGEMVGLKNGKPAPRTQFLSFLAEKFDLKPRVFLFDCDYYGEDLTGKKFSERNKILRQIGKKLRKEYFVVATQKIARTKEDLERYMKIMGKAPFSEGMIVREDAPYQQGASPTIAKIKNVLELKVIVLKKIANRAGGYNYEIGLKNDGKFINLTEDKKYVFLGKTFNTKLNAEVGDTLNVVFEEILILKEKEGLRLATGKPTVKGIDKTRGPYYAGQAIQMARRKGVLKEELEAMAKIKDIHYDPSKPNNKQLADDFRIVCAWYSSIKEGKKFKYTKEQVIKLAKVIYREIQRRVKEGKMKYEFKPEKMKPNAKELYEIITKSEITEITKIETRGERAIKFWEEHWHESYPKSGEGKFVLHAHIRGLSKKESEFTLDQLLQTDHSIHFDLRLQIDKKHLHGWTLFAKRMADNREKLLVEQLNDHKTKIQATPKLWQPAIWLDVGKKTPYISEPMGVGATTKLYAKFFVIDSGTYRIGLFREHAFEYFIRGKILRGRYLITFAPVAKRRIWLLSKPEDQKPYALSNKLEDILREIKAKGQKYLIWSDGKSRPVKYRAKEGTIVKRAKEIKLIFLGTGPTRPVKGKGKNNRTNSSLFISGPDILIDCTPQVLEQTAREKIKNINAILITHAHRDACMGLPLLDKKSKILVFAPPDVLAHPRLKRKFSNLLLRPIMPDETTTIYGLKITPFKVIHAEAFPTGKDFPCYGYKFDNSIYAEDMEAIPKDSEKYFKDIQIMIIDAAMWAPKTIRGHMNHKEALKLAVKYQPKILILTQAGRTYPSYETAQTEIEKYWKEIGGEGKVLLAYDGLTTSL